MSMWYRKIILSQYANSAKNNVNNINMSNFQIIDPSDPFNTKSIINLGSSLLPTIPLPSIQDFNNKIEELKKLLNLIKPELRQEFEIKLNEIKFNFNQTVNNKENNFAELSKSKPFDFNSNSSNFATGNIFIEQEYLEQVKNLNILQKNIQAEIKEQEAKSLHIVNNIVKKRNSQMNIDGEMVDTDKILKDYLQAENINDIMSPTYASTDIMILAKYFLYYANDPKFDSIKKILNNPKIPITAWASSAEILNLLQNFYLNDKLIRLRTDLLSKEDSFERDAAVVLINSRIATTTYQIAINVNNILAKNIVSKIIGNIGSLAANALNQFSDLTKTPKSIQETIEKIPK